MIDRTQIFAVLLTLSASALFAAPAEVQIIDAQTGWPVPLVELRTTHALRFVSDNAGVIALDAPELIGRECWFSIEGHGYSVPADGFGYRGVRLTPQAGQRQIVKVERMLPAKRVGRLTGGGLFAESQKLGQEVDWQESGVFGCDSVFTAVHRGRMFWVWGDTTLPHYPLGVFSATAATTSLAPRADWRPPLRIKYDYFRDAKGLPRGVANIPGDGPTWLGGLASLPDEQGQPRLVASYEKITPPLTAYETGLCVWDEAVEQFQAHKVLWRAKEGNTKSPPPFPNGHLVRYVDKAGIEWALVGNPFPSLKFRATFAAWSDPAQWQTLTPQVEVKVAGEEKSIRPHRGAIAYHKFRNRWVTVFTQQYGAPSALGELWYAEALAPEGPWGPAVKVVTHNNYTFYNPALHPELTPIGSPELLFEATYTTTFADHATPTPRHEYNQILYRLDLDDPALEAAQQAR